jgi:hypothetical protein
MMGWAERRLFMELRAIGIDLGKTLFHLERSTSTATLRRHGQIRIQEQEYRMEPTPLQMWKVLTTTAKGADPKGPPVSNAIVSDKQ